MISSGQIENRLVALRQVHEELAEQLQQLNAFREQLRKAENKAGRSRGGARATPAVPQTASHPPRERHARSRASTASPW
jgi:hypothetical protein